MEEDKELGKKLENLSLSDANIKTFGNKTLESFAERLKAGEFKKIALMVGAGVSVNAGIPDFRSKGGLYDKLKQKGYPKPEIIFDLRFFKEDPTLFYEIAKELDTSNAKPTLTHYFFKLLENKNLLLKCYTQNIDSLELEAGMSKNKLVQAHGHFESARCVSCKKQAEIQKLKENILKQTVLYCEYCGKPVKPDVVFFGEQLPEEFHHEISLLEEADLLIIIGTSLAVHPFASLVNFVPSTIPRILVNKYLENVHSFKFKDPNASDIAFQGDCDETFRTLANLCDWGEDLNKLIKNTSYLGSLDFGTGSTRFIVFDNKGQKVSMHQIEMTQYFPESNMHEQDPDEYLSTALNCIEKATEGIDISLIKAIGISNQRETVIAWDKNTGKPLHRAIIWDDARTADICKEFASINDKVKEKTGLPVSTYFSATKIVWLIRNIKEVQTALSENRCLFGTVESWVIFSITKEKNHVTDISNASRTMLMNLLGYWDEELLRDFGIPLSSLPKILSSAEVYGHVSSGVLKNIPISGALGDQQAALLAHHCLDKGSAKCTYGTGAFLLMNTGTTPLISEFGLLTTVYGKFGLNEEIWYALEGSVECAGSAVQWMKNQLGLFSDYQELDTLVNSVPDNGGVYCVPALSGIFAPYWKNDANGVIVGLSQHTTKAHIIRAVLEGVCFRTAELIKALNKDWKNQIQVLSVDGGMTKNMVFMQEQADIAGLAVEIMEEKDLTALGAAYAAGIGVGVFRSYNDLRKLNKRVEARLTPKENTNLSSRWKNWEDAIRRCLVAKL